MGFGKMFSNDKEIEKLRAELENTKKEYEDQLKNNSAVLSTHNEKIDKIQASLDSLVEAFQMCVKEFSGFVEALDKANRELELKRKYKSEALAEFRQNKQRILEEDDEKIELNCWKCGEKLVEKQNTYRCSNLVSKKNEDGTFNDTGCVTKIYKKYFDYPLNKSQIEDLLFGAEVVLKRPKIKGIQYKLVSIKLDKENVDDGGFNPFIECSSEK